MTLPSSLGNFAGFAGIAALAAGATAGWSQVKGILDRLISMVIVRVTLYSSSHNAFHYYMWRNAKISRAGMRTFTGDTHFIRPLGRKGKVGFELPGDLTMMFLGWVPVFISSQKNDENNAVGGNRDFSSSKIAFIRGTLDIEDILVKAITAMNDREHQADRGGRYAVYKRFGMSGMMMGGDKAVSRDSSYKNDDSGSHNYDWRPLKWTSADLGTPKENKPFTGLYYEGESLRFKTEVERWWKSKDWYNNRGIPWRMGALLKGPPGTGKTSMARAMAMELDLPVYQLDLQSMSNRELFEHWTECLEDSPCMVLFEDVDRLFGPEGFETTGKMTLDALLNCLSGVERCSGILVVATANEPEKLDAALTRPGRLDLKVEFPALSMDGKRAIASGILVGYPEAIENVVSEADGDSGAAFVERCRHAALALYWEGK